jgi:Tfp pilus assembly protein PilO
MNRRRMETFALAAVLAIVLGITCFFTWPNYAEASDLSSSSSTLEQKIGHLEDVEVDLKHRAKSLAALHREQERVCRQVPDRPDVANLMQHLSMGVDGQAVLDQTFTVRGRNGEAEDARFKILPLVVELETTFDNIFDVIQRVEQLKRLVRVTSITMTCRDVEFEQTQPTLRASIGMDVVYEHLDSEGD